MGGGIQTSERAGGESPTGLSGIFSGVSIQISEKHGREDGDWVGWWGVANWHK